jgi:hypothetical protein
VTALSHVFWLGGMSGVGKTTAARRIARRYDLRLYSLDSYTYAHDEYLPSEQLTLDERWVDPSPEELADRFEAYARTRFPLVLADLEALPADAPLLAEGPHLLPELVASVLADPGRAMFVTADPALQRELVTGRGSLTYAKTRDPERALANRLGRDAILAARVTASAAAAGLTHLEVAAVTATEAEIERHFRPLLEDWLTSGDRGDVAARRRDENDARLRQWRAYANDVPAAAAGRIGLACECESPGCGELVEVDLAEAEAARTGGEPLLAHA